MNYKTSFVLLSLTFSGFFYACKNEVNVQQKTIAILYDLSKSVDRTSLENYASLSSKLFIQLNDGDQIIGYKITEKSLMERNPIFQVVQPVLEKTSTNSIIKTKQTNDHKAFIKQLIENEQSKLNQELFADHSSIIQTDILASLHRAAATFKTKPSSKKYLFICSDMLEAENRVNFEKTDPNEKFTQNLIKSHVKDKILPDLNEVIVFVHGANAPNNEKYSKVKQFWLTYLTACGATIADHQYAAFLAEIPKL